MERVYLLGLSEHTFVLLDKVDVGLDIGVFIRGLVAVFSGRGLQLLAARVRLDTGWMERGAAPAEVHLEFIVRTEEAAVYVLRVCTPLISDWRFEALTLRLLVSRSQSFARVRPGWLCHVCITLDCIQMANIARECLL